MNKKERILIGIIIFATIGILGQMNSVEAALQASGAEGIIANVSDWIYYTRKMQEAGGGLGLTDKISDTDLTSSNKNFDIHMQKNTEYGAVAILSASAYGNKNKIADGETTTGNVSGVQIKLNGEWTASAPNNTKVWAMQVGKPRYWNNYGTGNGSNSKVGDAIAETNGWHGSTGSRYLSHKCWNKSEVLGGDCAFIRSYGASVFGFNGNAYSCNDIYYTGNYAPFFENTWCADHGIQGYHADCVKDAMYTNSWHGRACVVIGSGV